MTYLLVVCFILFLLFAVAGLIAQQRRLFRLQEEAQERERKLADDYRQREAELLNRILKQVGVKAVGPQVEVENVVKLPDPEIAPPDWIDLAFRQDEIKELIEEGQPDMAHLSAEEMRNLYPRIWSRYEAMHAEQHTPLRAG